MFQTVGGSTMKATEQASARIMRKNGYSVGDIEKELGVSRSSVSIWVRDIELTEEQKKSLKEKSKKWAGQNKGAQTNRDRSKAHRTEVRGRGYKKAESDTAFQVICALYWGEGTKSTNNTAAIANADADVLRFWGKWLLEEGYEDCIRFRIRYYGENGVSEEKIKQQWIDWIPFLKDKHIKKFTRCIINRASQRKKIGKLPYGTGELSVCNSDLWEILMGGIDFLRATSTTG